MTVFGQFALAYAWKLPALLFAGWLAVIFVRRRMIWWYLAIAPALCEILACFTFFGGLFMGHARSESGGSDADLDLMLTSVINMATVFATTVVLLILTSIVDFARLPARRPRSVR